MVARKCCMALAIIYVGLAVWVATRQHALPWWLCAPLLIVVALLILYCVPPRPAPRAEATPAEDTGELNLGPAGPRDWLAEREGRPVIVRADTREDAERICKERGLELQGKLVTLSYIDKARVAEVVREMGQRDELGRVGRQ